MKKAFAITIATWFGTGLIPPIITKGFAGTWGTLGAIPFCYGALWLTHQLDATIGFVVYCVIGLALLLLGGWSLQPAMDWLEPWLERRRHRPQKMYHDQYEIVVDEVLGMFITCVPLFFFPEVSPWYGLGVATVLFRIFDGTKPWPIRHFDRKSGRMNIIWDDVIAGIMAAFVLTIVLPRFF